MGTTGHSEATVVVFGRLGVRQQGTNIDMHVGHCKVQGCMKQTHPVGQNLAPQEILYGHFHFFRLAFLLFLAISRLLSPDHGKRSHNLFTMA